MDTIKLSLFADEILCIRNPKDVTKKPVELCNEPHFKDMDYTSICIYQNSANTHLRLVHFIAYKFYIKGKYKQILNSR